MTGLTRSGFTTKSYESIVEDIEDRLKVFSPGIDLSVESPDGQLISIMSILLSQIWNELSLVYNSNNPSVATGAGLRNIALISGQKFIDATNSRVTLELGGVAGTPVPAGSLVSSSDGTVFSTELDATISGHDGVLTTVKAVATVFGPIPVPAGSVETIDTQISGWNTVTQSTDGSIGAVALSDGKFRNIRTGTVLKNFTSVDDVIKARLLNQLGIGQATVINNDSLATVDGIPPRTIHVIIGKVSGDKDAEIAKIILNSKGLGCPTHGTTVEPTRDSQGNIHQVRFTKATPRPIHMEMHILFLDSDYSGLDIDIKKDLASHINGLLAGEPVRWSRLFGIITPYGRAVVDGLKLGITATELYGRDLVLGSAEYATITISNINIIIDNT